MIRFPLSSSSKGSIVKQEILALKGTFSDQDGDGDLFDQTGWRIDGWEAHSGNHTVSPAESRSALGYASSASGLRLLTTWPCVVDASYLLGVPPRYELLRWIELGGVTVYPFSAHHLADMIGWMENYTEAGKREMDEHTYPEGMAHEELFNG